MSSQRRGAEAETGADRPWKGDMIAFLAGRGGAPRSTGRAPASSRRRRITHADIAGAREHELVALARTGDDRAARILLEAHEPIMRRWAERTATWSHVEIDDLMQAAREGFMEGVEKFDPSRGVKLISMVNYWIRSGVEKFAQSTMRTIRLPAGQQAAIVAEHKRGEKRLHGVRHRDAAKTLFFNAPISVETSIGDDGASPLRDTLRCTRPLADDQLDEAWRREKLARFLGEALDTLSPRERLVLEARITNEKRMTLQAIGHELGLSRERVRQIQEGAIQKLRLFLTEHALPSDADLLGDAANRILASV